MPLAGHQHNVAGAGQPHRTFYGFAPVRIDQIGSLILPLQPLTHIFQNIHGLLVTGIVRGQYQLVAVLEGNLCHFRPFALVTVAAASDHRQYALPGTADFQDSPQHILQRVRRVGVIHNGGHIATSMNAEKTSLSRLKRTQVQQKTLLVLPQQAGGCINGDKVIGVKLTRQTCPDLLAVQFQLHPLHLALHHTDLEIGIAAFQTVSVRMCRRILQHDASVRIICVGQGESCRGQIVEKGLFRRDIGGKCLVVVKMVVGDVAENATRKMQCRNTLLNFAFEGASGMEKMQALMQALRDNAPTAIAGLCVKAVSDYQSRETVDTATGAKTPIDLPRSNVLRYLLPGGSGVIVRPSGTEPKIKVYITAVAEDAAAADALGAQIAADMRKIMHLD